MRNVSSFVFLLVTLLCSALPGFGQGYVGQLGAGTGASMNGPTGLAVDTVSGTTYLYVAEYLGGRVLRYNLTTGSATPTVIASGMNQPNGIGIDPTTRDLYVSERAGNRITRMTNTGTVLFSWGGTAPADVTLPVGVAVDASGAVYVGEHDPANRLKKFTVTNSGGVWTATAAGAPWPLSGFSTVYGVMFDGTNVLIADGGNRTVKRFTTAGAAVPGDIVVDRIVTWATPVSGAVYTAQTNGDGVTGGRIQRFPSGSTTANLTWGEAGTEPGQFRLPFAVAVNGSQVYVSDFENDRIQIFDLTITGAPVVNSATTASATVGTPFTYQIAGTNSPFAFNATGLPAGLSVNTSTGVISGTPTAGGSFSVALTARNNLGTSPAATLALTVSGGGSGDTTPPTVASFSGSASGTTATFNLNFSESVRNLATTMFTATGSGGLTGATVTSVTPNGATLATAFVVNVSYTGTSGSVQLALNASSTGIQDASGNAFGGAGGPNTTATATLAPAGDTTAPTVTSFALDIPNATLTSARMIITFSEPVTGVDAADFVINTTGTASATITSVAQGATAATYNVNFNYGGTSGSLQMGIRTSGTSIADSASNAFAGGGVAATVAYSVNSAPPADMTLPAVSSFTAGTPAGSSVNFTLTFTEAITGLSASDILVSVPGATVGAITGSGTTYTVPLTFSGSGPVQLTVVGGATTDIRDAATHWFAGGMAAATASVTFGGSGSAPTIAASQTAPSGTVGTAFSYQVVATGATSFSTTSTLPAGLTLSSSGLISGTPTAATPAGGTTIAVTATNATGNATGNVVLNIAAAGAAPTIAASQTAPSGTVGTAFSYQVVATGATSFSTTSTLPAGLTLSSSGLISGTPTAATPAGGTTIAVRVTNANGNATGNVVLTIAAAGAAPTIAASQTAPSGTVGTAFSYQVVATGATSFSTTSTLPAGLTLSSTGLISGTPTAATPAGGTTIAVRVTNANGNATGNVVLNIGTASTPSVPVVANATVSGQVGTAISPVTVSATNSPTSFAASGLSTYGLSISSTGVITGVPTTTASGVAVSVTASNAAGTSTPATITLNIAAAPITPPIFIPPIFIPPAAQNQTIAFVPPVSSIFVNQPFQLGATASSNLPVTYTVVSGNAVINGSHITIQNTQPVRVRASQNGNGSWNPAAPVEVTLNAVKAAQSINFPSMSNKLTTDSTITLAATSNSGLPITYTLISGPATLNGNLLRLTGAPGTVVVRASQGGDAAFNAATEVIRSFAVNPAVRVVNLSSRLRVTAGDGSRAVIAGFVIDGTADTSVLVRAVGPGLAQFGIQDALAAPRLQLFDGASNVIAENNGWNGAADVSTTGDRVGAFKLQAGSNDSAVVATLKPGAYTAMVSSTSGNGTVLIEVYDAATGAQLSTQQLVNISTRGFVDTGDGALIAGFVVDGSTSKRVLVRGIGPGLTAFGVPSALADPTLKIYAAGRSDVVAENDNWETATDIAAAITAAGAFPLAPGSKDAGIVLTLPPGQYSAVVSGANNTTGAGLVEVYELRNP